MPAMPLGRRQLFVYWKVAAADLNAALQALRDWQAALVRQHPALHCRIYRRSDAAATEATVMESYAMALPPAGIDETLQRQIVQAGDAVLQPWVRGARHVEVFDACDA